MSKKGFKSIQSIIAFFFSSLFIIIFIITGFIAYYLTEDTARKNSMNYTLKIIENVNGNIHSYIEYMKNISSIVINNKDVLDYYSNFKYLTDGERETYQRNISNFITSILQARKDINLILLTGYEGDIISNRDSNSIKQYINIVDREWYKSAKAENGNTVISSSHVQDILIDEYRWVVSLSVEIKSLENNEPLGILLVDLNFNVIEELCEEKLLGNRSYMFIVDSNAEIVYHPQIQLIYSELKTELIDEVINTNNTSFVINNGIDSRIYTVKTNVELGWKICGVTYTNELITNKNIIQFYFSLIGIIFILLIIIVSILISKKISKPIKVLQGSMKEVQNGNFKINIKVKSSNEIGELEKDFSIMIKKIKALISQNEEKQKLIRESELKALQAQINPHFLYNTLETIICMAKSENDVIRITAALAKLLRIGISKGKELVTIEDEVEHVRSYLIIQKIRYMNKFDYIINIDNNILNYKIIKIILQPLVENAIYHGVKKKLGAGSIKINGNLNGENINLQVIDDGIGMTKERITEVFENDCSKFPNSGIGISNVNERIKLYFGNKYGLSCISKENEGTKIDIVIPKIEGEQI
jgi:two-component system sensor histidine kinase YesM